MTKDCDYKGHKEKCLIDDSYPISKGGPDKINCKRVRNAAARGAQQGVLSQLKSEGLCHYLIDVCHAKRSSVCD